MNEPLISVLMVNCNHADTIGESIRSVLDQTWTNLRLVIVDDGSTDGSVEAAEPFLSDPRVELFRLPRNEHICAATNFGFSKVEGEWLARIDSDDVWYPNRLERQMRALRERPELDICFSWCDWIDEKGREISESVPDLVELTQVAHTTQREWLRQFYYEGNCLLHSSVLMRTSLMRETGGFDLAYRMLHDFDYWVRVAKRRNLLVIPERLIAMRHVSERGRHASERSEENDTRTFNEYVDIRSHMFEGMPDAVFRDAFGEDFVCPDSSTPDELACERAFLLCRPQHGWVSEVNPAGLAALRSLLADEGTRSLLERRFGFRVHDFYRLSKAHCYNDPHLQHYFLEMERSYDAQVSHLIEESLGLQAERARLEGELARLREENSRLAEKASSLERSLSWRVTRPLRAASALVRRVGRQAPAAPAPLAPPPVPSPATVLVHAFLAGNLGDDLFVRMLCDRFPETRFLVAAPGDYEGRFSDVPNLEVRPPTEFADLVRSADAVAHIGGCCFVQHEEDFSRFFETDRYLAENSSHLVFLGGNFGPYTDEEYLRAYRELFRLYDGVSFRDRYSAGLFPGCPNVSYAPDILFGYPARVRAKRRHAVVSPVRMEGRGGRFGIERYADAYRAFTLGAIRSLLDRGYEVTLVSFCEAQGDELEVDELLRELAREGRDGVGTALYRSHPSEVMGAFEDAELVVATRFHSMILGIAHGCKVLPVVYDQKTQKVLDDLGGMLEVRLEELGTVDPGDVVGEALGSSAVDPTELARGSRGHFRFLDSVLEGVAEDRLAHGAPERRRCTVLFVNGCDLSTLRRYRVEHQREQLELWGVDTDEVSHLAVTPEDAERADVFVVYRCPSSPAVERFIARAHALGRRVFFDVDDLVTDTSYTDSLPVVRAMSPEDREVFSDGVRRTGRTLSLCDGAIVTTERLAAELSKVVPTVFVNRNVASREMVALSERAARSVRRDPDRVVLGYFSGSMTHNSDFAEALPAVVSVLSQREHVYLKVVGDLELPDALGPFSDRVIRADKVSWRDLPSLIASADVNLAPLEATLFNEAKSENKWTEAALVGVPTVASDFGAFAVTVDDGKTGMLCSTQEQWETALLRLVDSPELRERIGRRARERALERHVTERTGYGLARLLTAAPASIDRLLPRDEAALARLVRERLELRGLRRRDASYDPEPWRSVPLETRLEGARAAGEAGRRVLLLIYERDCGDTATFRYFGHNVEQRLADSDRWHATHVFTDELSSAQELLETASALSLIRCRVRPELLSLAEWAKSRGVRVAYLIDDNALGAKAAPRIIELMATDPDNEFEQRFWRGTTERFRLASELADALVVPNAYFADLLRGETDRPVLVVHSSVNDEQVGVAETILSERTEGDDARFVVGYFSGTSSHQEDFALVEDSVVELLERHDDAALLIGGDFRLSERLLGLFERGRVILMPKVDYVTLQYLQASVDVVLAPLVSNEFTNCKSALKVFEAGLVGVPSCASSTFAYVEAIRDGATGYACETKREWDEALEALWEDGERRRAMGAAARELALANYYGDAVRQEVESALDALADTPQTAIPEEVGSALERSGVSDWDNPFEASPAFS